MRRQGVPGNHDKPTFEVDEGSAVAVLLAPAGAEREALNASSLSVFEAALVAVTGGGEAPH